MKKVEKMKIKKINMVSVRFALETKIFGSSDDSEFMSTFKIYLNRLGSKVGSPAINLSEKNKIGNFF